MRQRLAQQPVDPAFIGGEDRPGRQSPFSWQSRRLLRLSSRHPPGERGQRGARQGREHDDPGKAQHGGRRVSGRRVDPSQFLDPHSDCTGCSANVLPPPNAAFDTRKPRHWPAESGAAPHSPAAECVLRMLSRTSVMVSSSPETRSSLALHLVVELGRLLTHQLFDMGDEGIGRQSDPGFGLGSVALDPRAGIARNLQHGRVLAQARGSAAFARRGCAHATPHARTRRPPKPRPRALGSTDTPNSDMRSHRCRCRSCGGMSQVGHGNQFEPAIEDAEHLVVVEVQQVHVLGHLSFTGRISESQVAVTLIKAQPDVKRCVRGGGDPANGSVPNATSARAFSGFSRGLGVRPTRTVDVQAGS